MGYVYKTFLGGMSSEALNPEPVTELPLTPPAEEDEEDAAIARGNFKVNTKMFKKQKTHVYNTDKEL